MLPSIDKIEKWTDEQLKLVHKLLFEDNANPSLGESKEEVDDYLYNVYAEHERRFSKTEILSVSE